MRNVPRLRFKEFNDEWLEKKFKELVLLQRGSSPRPIVKFITTSQDGVNWIKIGDTNKESQFITSTSEKITKEGAKKSREVKKGEIILSNSMSFGRPFILKIDGYIHDGWFVLRNYEKNFNKEFLCQLLGSEIVQKQYKKLAAGGVVENISSELVNSVDINLPTIKEQQKIADFILNIDKKISITEEKLDLFKEYKKGIMQKIFNQELRFKDINGNYYPEWKEKKLKEIVMFKKGVTLSKADLSNNGEYKCILYGELFTQYNELIKKVISKTNCNYKKNGKKFDILMPTSDVTPNGLARACCLLEDDIILSGDMNVLTPLKDLYSCFFVYLLNYEKNKIIERVTGTTVKHIYVKDIEDIVYSIPVSFEEQQKIADFLSSIDTKIEKISDELKILKEFKKGLLQQMFV